MKKILIYNWLPFDEKEGKGGGVSVYTKNLIRSLIDQKDWQVYFLSSGRAYDVIHRGVFIEPTKNVFGKSCKSFQLVNSPVLSPAHLSFVKPQIYCRDVTLKRVLRRFCLETGGFDVIHFQNLEGLSLSVLELKKDFPKTKFIFSMHNYYVFCPQVMLWRDNSANCQRVRCGASCVSCMPKDVHYRKVIFNQWINYKKNREGSVGLMLEKLQGKIEDCCRLYDSFTKGRMLQRRKNRLSEEFRYFREKNICYINQYMDKVLAVSQRTAELAVRYGLREDKVKVSYIGTEVAAQQKESSQYPFKGKTFQICYMGYMRKMKGFYFLIDVLEEMPIHISKRIELKFAVRDIDTEMKERMTVLRKKYAEVMVYNGYTHDELPQILEGVQLGIVPSMWEDNLPQVAIEMRAYGIPLLVSDLGGAQELTLSRDFVFKAGDKNDFLGKLSALIECPDRIEEYWVQAPKLTTMYEHIEELMKYYKEEE